MVMMLMLMVMAMAVLVVWLSRLLWYISQIEWLLLLLSLL